MDREKCLKMTLCLNVTILHNCGWQGRSREGHSLPGWLLSSIPIALSPVYMLT